MRTTARWGAGLLALGLLAGPGCGDDELPPPSVPTGLRFVLPGDAGDLGSVRLELWHRDDVPPPTCDGGLPPAKPVQPDLCTRGQYTIWNILGETVKTVSDEPWAGRAPGWDRRDDDGNPVSSGIYPIQWRCLDSAGSLTFSGHYYVHGDAEQGRCDWLVWSETVNPRDDGLIFEIGPFPIDFSILTLNADTTGTEEVVFGNPYLARVRAPGREVHEQAVTLVESELTEVRASLPWLPDGPGAPAPENPRVP